MKKCTKCKKQKKISEFYKSNRKGIPIVQQACKNCYRKDRTSLWLKRRITIEEIPDLSNEIWKNIKGKPTIELISDEQWLNEHAFYVNASGALDLRKDHCEPEYMA